jgi:hypothetical protein
MREGRKPLSAQVYPWTTQRSGEFPSVRGKFPTDFAVHDDFADSAADDVEIQPSRRSVPSGRSLVSAIREDDNAGHCRPQVFRHGGSGLACLQLRLSNVMQGVQQCRCSLRFL